MKKWKNPQIDHEMENLKIMLAHSELLEKSLKGNKQ